MLSGMSLRQPYSGEARRVGVVSPTSLGKSGGRGRISAHCVLGQVSSCSPILSSSFCRKVCPIRVAYHSESLIGSPIAVQGGRVAKCINPFGSGTLNCKPEKQIPKFGWRISFTSLSRWATLSSKKNPSGRPEFNVEARVSDVSGASSAAEAVSGNASSTSISSPTPLSRGSLPVNLLAGVGISGAVFLMAVLGFIAKPSTNGGSVADLIKRGQLRSDRGTESKNLRYDDPFNNPLVKMGDKNPIVKMCGKIFRLAPVTLTDEKMIKHQNRRIQAYRWRRPQVFLNEGEPVPEGLDPEEVRWIPSNHPFATTTSNIDEELAQQNVYQTRGVPSLVRAEHEALRKKIMQASRGEPELQPPNLDYSGSQSWKTLDEAPETSGTLSRDEGEAPDSAATVGKQVNGRAGGNPRRNIGAQGATRSGVSESRYGSIDFSGEEQGSGRK